MADLGNFFMDALGGAFQGWGKGALRGREEKRQSLLDQRAALNDATERELRGAQITNVKAEGQARLDAARRREAFKGYLGSAEGQQALAAMQSPDDTVRSAAVAKLAPYLSDVENAGAWFQGLAPHGENLKDFAAKQKIIAENRAPPTPYVTVLPGTTPGAPAQMVTAPRAGGQIGAPSITALEGTTKTPPKAPGATTPRFGQGGPFGAASGLGSLEEMHAIRPALENYETKLLAEPEGSPGLKLFDQWRLGVMNAAQHAGNGHGAIATSVNNFMRTGAAEEMARMNPELAEYWRGMAQWIVADLNLTRSASDERGRMDQIASSVLAFPMSSMPFHNRRNYVRAVIAGRRARLKGLDQVKPGIENMLRQIGGQQPPFGQPDEQDQQDQQP